MPIDHGEQGPGLLPAPFAVALVAGVAVLIGLAAALYLAAAAAQPRTGRSPWPGYRTGLWLLGLATIAAAVLAPFAGPAHRDLSAHLGAHLLTGMLAPLLIALSAPVTLALRTLDVAAARRLSRLLNTRCARFLTEPAPAAVLNVGSLWVLYATPVGGPLIGNPVAHHLLLIHFFLAGYLFTVSVVGLDPAPHRRSFPARLAVLVLAIAAHASLAKYVFAHPPGGTPVAAAERAAMLMYYGGDLLELALLVVFCAQWYRASRPAAAGLPRG